MRVARLALVGAGAAATVFGIVLVLIAGLLLVLPVHPRPTVLEGAEREPSSKPAA